MVEYLRVYLKLCTKFRHSECQTVWETLLGLNTNKAIECPSYMVQKSLRFTDQSLLNFGAIWIAIQEAPFPNSHFEMAFSNYRLFWTFISFENLNFYTQYLSILKQSFQKLSHHYFQNCNFKISILIWQSRRTFIFHVLLKQLNQSSLSVDCDIVGEKQKKLVSFSFPTRRQTM